ncbi:hypothetical protein ABEF93_002451 [Exophiala dermatitidis]
MEADNPSTFSAKPPPLTSDQLNYLIWRYLQESGYAEAAVKLQRDWRVDAESLPFAKNIKGHALVSLVQKGLRYHHLSLTIDENGRPSKQLNPSMFFFGPESVKPPPELPEETLAPASSPPGPNAPLHSKVRDAQSVGPHETATHSGPKRSRKGERNGSAARKPSASATRSGNASVMDVDMVNGHPPPRVDARSPSATETGLDENTHLVNGTRTDDRMDVDDESLNAEQANHESHIEALPPSHPSTTGPSIGVQVAPAKVTDLSGSTTLLQIPSTTEREEAKTITRSAWRPGDNDCLAAMGDDFCTVWKSINQGSDAVDHLRFQELVDCTEAKLVSALAWDPIGDVLAVATYSDPAGEILLFDGQELNLMEAVPASQKAIMSLRWHSRGLRLLGIAPYSSDAADSARSAGSTILLWDLSRSPNIAGPLSICVPEILMDMDCASFGMNGVVCVAGGTAVYHCRAFSDLSVENKWTSDSSENDQWTFVRCAWRGPTDGTVVVASGDTASLWLPAHNLMKREAHGAPITGLELRPHAPDAIESPAKPEFATSSMDGTIKIWRCDDSNTITSICKLIIGHASPVMTLSYSPDGFCLAGASYDTVRIWNAEHGHSPMATWKGEQESWRGSKLKEDDALSVGGMSGVNGESSQAIADHTLAWDEESKKLAFGLGAQIAVINFQR